MPLTSPGRRANMETALTEALYLAALERNGDVVHMSSYAPLLAKDGRTQWNPDLIYFNNRGSKTDNGILCAETVRSERRRPLHPFTDKP